ncbi:MAG: hypothetical protein AAGD09_13715 [Cyanobacteria bacterium P01_F01_bin.56]
MNSIKKTDPKTFLVLFVRGGGSTFLAELINQIDGFTCLREPKLNQKFFIENNLSYLQYLQKIDDKKMRKTCTQRVSKCFWVGAKNKLYDQVNVKIRGRILDVKMPVIFIIRRDIIRHAIGLCRKDLAAKSVVWSEAERLKPCRIELRQFSDTLKWILDRNREIKKFHDEINTERRLLIYYEDLYENKIMELRKLLLFLGENDSNLKIEKENLPVKHTSDAWEESVVNSDEIKHYIQSIDSKMISTSNVFEGGYHV